MISLSTKSYSCAKSKIRITRWQALVVTYWFPGVLKYFWNSWDCRKVLKWWPEGWQRTYVSIQIALVTWGVVKFKWVHRWQTIHPLFLVLFLREFLSVGLQCFSNWGSLWSVGDLIPEDTAKFHRELNSWSATGPATPRGKQTEVSPVLLKGSVGGKDPSFRN